MPDLIERNRPTDEGLAREWTPEVRRRVLDDVMAEETTRIRGRRRIWPIAVAATFVAALLIGAPVTVPGWFTKTAAAAELARVAEGAADQAQLEWTADQFLRVSYVDTQTGMPGGTPRFAHDNWRVTFTDYHTTDGWVWSDRVTTGRQWGRTVNGVTERFIFPPAGGWLRPDFAAAMPAEPHALDAFLRARAVGSSSIDEAVFVAIGDMLGAEAAPPQVRAAAIAVLGLNPKVTAERTEDALGRVALKVSFVDEALRPDLRQFLFLAPETGDLLASGRSFPGYEWQRLYIDREIVDALPPSLAADMGTDKVAKGPGMSGTSNPGPDPTPLPAQSYTPAPSR